MPPEFFQMSWKPYSCFLNTCCVCSYCREQQFEIAKDSEGSHAEEIASFQHKLEQRTKEAEQAKSDLKARDAEVRGAQMALSQKQDELAILMARLAERDVEVVNFAAELRAKEGELRGARKKVLESGMQLGNLKAALTKRESEISRYATFLAAIAILRAAFSDCQSMLNAPLEIVALQCLHWGDRFVHFAWMVHSVVSRLDCLILGPVLF